MKSMIEQYAQITSKSSCSITIYQLKTISYNKDSKKTFLICRGNTMAELKLNNIQKVIDKDVVAADDFNFDIKDEEFIVFVGPSGGSKSTSLRMIAGLEEISTKNLYIDD